MLIFKHAALSDVGRNRELNEDNYLVKDVIFAVADGMGGHLAGEIASNIALKSVARNLKRLRPPAEQIKKAFKVAHGQIIKQAKYNIKQRGMGTTMTLAAVVGKNLWLGHVGDSRAYLYRQGKLSQLTEDHTLVARLVKDGKISAQDARTHPKQHVITKAIGGQEDLEADVFSIKIKKDDRLLLCTDGLTTMLDDKEIESMVSVVDRQEAAKLLVDKANEKGGYDNITVIVVDVLEADKQKVELPVRRWLAFVFLTLFVLGLAFKLFLFGLQRVYFIGSHRQKVAIFQGLPATIWGYSLFKLSKSTDLPLKELPDYYRRRIEKGIVVGGIGSTESTLKDIKSFRESD